MNASLTDKRHIAGATAAWIMTIPSEGDWPFPTVEAYVQAMLEQVAASWAETTGADRIPVGQFVRRFTGAEMDAIVAAGQSDANVSAILAQLDAVPTVRLGHATTVQAMAYLVGVGLLTQARADAITDYVIPDAPESPV